MPNGRCYRHGGASVPPGPGHHSYRNGSRSKLKLAGDLSGRLEAARTDPELMTVNRDVEALEARLGMLLESIDTGASAGFCGLVGKLVAAIESADADQLRELVPQVKSQAATAQREVEAWEEYARIADSKRKLIESHRKAQAESGQLILASHMAMMLEQMLWAALNAEDLRAAQLRQRQLFAQFMGVYDQKQRIVEQDADDDAKT